MAVTTGMPQGPGFLMFFQNERTNNPHKPDSDRDKIMKDDNEILEIVTMLTNCCGLLE